MTAPAAGVVHSAVVADGPEFQRLFTVDEAERTLPLVRAIVRDILALGAEAHVILADRGRTARIEELEEQLRELLAELEAMGCFYKDWNFRNGLVDFPALVDGEVVFLCWRSDEPKLGYYHRIEDGYDGRRPLAGGG